MATKPPSSDFKNQQSTILGQRKLTSMLKPHEKSHAWYNHEKQGVSCDFIGLVTNISARDFRDFSNRKMDLTNTNGGIILELTYYLGVSWKWGYPIAGWFLLGKIPLKWMMTGGTAISGNHQIYLSHSEIWWMMADDDDDDEIWGIFPDRLRLPDFFRAIAVC